MNSSPRPRSANVEEKDEETKGWLPCKRWCVTTDGAEGTTTQ